MSATDIAFYRKKIHQMGRWIGVRYLRNRGISLTQAHIILFNCLPRFPEVQ